MRVLVTRPEADAAGLAARLAEGGVDSLVEPLMRVVPTADPLPDLDTFQGLLITSANGVRALAARTDRRDLPVWAVGDASARTARDAGFTAVASAAGDVEALAGLVTARCDPAAGPLLHVAGTQVAGDLAGRLATAGFSYARAVLYAARTVEALSAPARTALGDGTVQGVLLFSPRTARTFVDLAAAAGLTGALAGQTAFCLSAAVADAVAGAPWAERCVAARPDQPSLVALVLERAVG